MKLTLPDGQAMVRRLQPLPSARVVWLTDSTWPGLNERRARLLSPLLRSATLLVLEPPPPRRLADPRVRWWDGVAIGQVMPLLNTRVGWARRAFRLRVLRSLAERAAGQQVARGVRATFGDDITPTLVVCSGLYLHRAARRLRPNRLVLDVCHDPRRFPGAPPWASERLARAALDSDLVLTSSVALASELRAAGIRDVRLQEEMPGMGGVDRLARAVSLCFDGSADVAVPRRASGPPSVEYRGPLGRGLDFDLIADLARRCPELLLRLVGWVDPAAAPQVSQVARLPNVLLQSMPPTGPARVRREEPAALIFPLLAQSGTRGALPAITVDGVPTGTPIVSTVPADASHPVHAVDVCPDREAFIRVVRLRTRTRAVRLPLWDRGSVGPSSRAARSLSVSLPRC